MWTYQQSTGIVWQDGQQVGKGYAGGNIPPLFDGRAVNNPARQMERCIGPLPRGFYTIGQAVDGTQLGPCAMPLTPDSSNQMFGRSGFFAHADSIKHPGQASEGCPVLPDPIRLSMAASEDKRFQVIE